MAALSVISLRKIGMSRRSATPSARKGHNMPGARVLSGRARFADTPPRGSSLRSSAMSEVLYDVAGGVARVTINRPQRRNAMSYDVMTGP